MTTSETSTASDPLAALHRYVVSRPDYNTDTGTFTWRDGKRAGQIAGGYKA